MAARSRAAAAVEKAQSERLEARERLTAAERELRDARDAYSKAHAGWRSATFMAAREAAS